RRFAGALSPEEYGDFDGARRDDGFLRTKGGVIRRREELPLNRSGKVKIEQDRIPTDEAQIAKMRRIIDTELTGKTAAVARRRLNGEAYEEIARAEGMTVNHAYQAFSRAKKRLAGDDQIRCHCGETFPRRRGVKAGINRLPAARIKALREE